MLMYRMETGHVAVYYQASVGDCASGGDGMVQNKRAGEVRVSTEGSRENKVVRIFRMVVGGDYDSEELIA